MLSNTQIDKLGGRLRRGEVDADILHKLEQYRAMHSEAYRHVERVLVETMGMQITGRPSKSTVALIEKLKRETIRLNQVQDVAGCRVLVDNLAEQDLVIENLMVLLSDLDLQIDDKRRESTNGYRAVHVVAKKDGRPVEIQVRTRIQHAWAEISEKLADAVGHSIKYGAGDEDALRFLDKLSVATGKLEVVRHERMVNISRKSRLGRTKELLVDAKQINEREKNLLREIRSLFRGVY